VSKILRPARHITGHFGDGPPGNIALREYCPRAFGTWAIFPQLREITIDFDASHYLHTVWVSVSPSIVGVSYFFCTAKSLTMVVKCTPAWYIWTYSIVPPLIQWKLAYFNVEFQVVPLFH